MPSACLEADGGAEVRDLAATAHALELASVFSFVEESLSGEAAASAEESLRLQMRFATALPLARACDVAEEWIRPRTTDLRRAVPSQSFCGMTFRSRPAPTLLGRKPLLYRGCLSMRAHDGEPEREVELTLAAPRTTLGCADAGPVTDAGRPS
jgi:hypothetical protein